MKSHTNNHFAVDTIHSNNNYDIWCRYKCPEKSTSFTIEFLIRFLRFQSKRVFFL